MKKDQPIGIFDSGIGGLTYANAIVRELPNEQIIYFGDTAHLPYGDKSADAICYYSLKIAKFLVEKNCKLIVIACNSAASTAHKVLIDFFGDRVPFISVVEPLVETIAQQEFQKVGVIATKATITSGIYANRLHDLAPKTEVASLATPLLVPMIEEGFFENNISHSIIHNYLENPILENIQALLLACTHYPLIRKEIEAFYEGKVKVFDSTDIVATYTRQLLADENALSTHRSEPHRFYVSDYTTSFEKTTQLFYPNERIQLEQVNMW